MTKIMLNHYTITGGYKAFNRTHKIEKMRRQFRIMLSKRRFRKAIYNAPRQLSPNFLSSISTH
jgi:hypothetical protein